MVSLLFGGGVPNFSESVAKLCWGPSIAGYNAISLSRDKGEDHTGREGGEDGLRYGGILHVQDSPNMWSRPSHQ